MIILKSSNKHQALILSFAHVKSLRLSSFGQYNPKQTHSKPSTTTLNKTKTKTKKLEILRIQVGLQFVSSFLSSRTYQDPILVSFSYPLLVSLRICEDGQYFTTEGTRKVLQYMNLRCRFNPGSSRNHTKKENPR